MIFARQRTEYLPATDTDCGSGITENKAPRGFVFVIFALQARAPAGRATAPRPRSRTTQKLRLMEATKASNCVSYLIR